MPGNYAGRCTVTDGHTNSTQTNSSPADSTRTDRSATLRPGRISFALVLTTTATLAATLLAPAGRGAQAFAEDAAPAAHTLTLTVAGKSRWVTTSAATVRDLLATEHVSVGARDILKPAVTTDLATVSAVQVVRVKSKTVVRGKILWPRTIIRKTAKLAKGQRRALNHGYAGRYTVKVQMTYHDGKLAARRHVYHRTTRPAPRVVLVGTARWPVNHRLHWAALARCESGGNPRIVDASGQFFGLYQFTVGTWHSVGGTGLPTQASAAEQTYRAQVLYNSRGRSPWPVCGQYL